MFPFLPQSQWTRSYVEDRIGYELQLNGGRLFSAMALDLGTDQGATGADTDVDPGSRSAPGENVVGQAAAASSKSERTISGVASVEGISRTHYLIKLDGLDLRGFKRNPIVLACHSQFAWGSLMPGAIAQVGKIAVEGKKLVFERMAFDDDELSLAWWNKIQRRTVRMLSIGFFPFEYRWVDPAKTVPGHYEFTTTELTEISVTPVGANRGAFFDPPARRGDDQAVEALRKEVAELREASSRLASSLGAIEAQQAMRMQSLSEDLDSAIASLKNHRS